jgi:hypothetical protein
MAARTLEAAKMMRTENQKSSHKVMGEFMGEVSLR